jgi:predicted RNA binding protein YcfA (HicA-like mRNA interferase family)
MKRRELIRYLETNGCVLLREGKKHSVYLNKIRRKVSTVPRHKKISDFLAQKICRDLEIPLIKL